MDWSPVSLRLKRKIASVENSGDITGDLGIRQPMIDELHRRGYFPETEINDARRNPALRDMLVNVYFQLLSKMTGVIDEDELVKKAWLSPELAKGNPVSANIQNQYTNRPRNFDSVYNRNFWWMDRPGNENLAVPQGADLDEFLRRIGR